MVSTKVSVALLALLCVAATLAEENDKRSCSQAAEELQSFAQGISESLLNMNSSPVPDPTSLLNCFTQNGTNISAIMQCILSKITGSSAATKVQTANASDLIASLQERASSVAKLCE